MLFLPDSVYEARRNTLKEVASGKLTKQLGWERILERDAEDRFALLELGRIFREAGDLSQAADYLWKAVQAQPVWWAPYMELAEMWASAPEKGELSNGLYELALRKLAEDRDALRQMRPGQLPFSFPAVEPDSTRSLAEQFEQAANALAASRENELPVVTERLRPYRLVQTLLDQPELTPEFTASAVALGESIAPFLVGVLRGWAREVLSDGQERCVENALALLGETGGASALPHLLEFVVRDPAELAGAAGWAMNRLIARHPAASAKVFSAIAARLDTEERLAVTERLLRFPKLDASGVIFERLAENLKSLPDKDRAYFLPLLLSTLVTVRGRSGVTMARAILRKNGALFPRDTRMAFEDVIENVAALPPGSQPPLEDLPWTVEDICAGNAMWEEDEDEDGGEDEEEEEEDGELARTRPAAKAPAGKPGRNQPCWCGSGVKYKKCHMESDERPAPGAK